MPFGEDTFKGLGRGPTVVEEDGATSTDANLCEFSV